MTDRLERLLNLVIALRETHRPLPAAEIRRRVAGYGQPDAEAFRRMFERDKADLRALGVPLETAPIDRFSDQIGYRIDPRRYDLPPVQLEPDELAALAVALTATGLADEVGTGLLKLGVDADRPDAARVDRLGPTAVEVDLAAPHRSMLVEAQLSRTTVRFTYASPGRTPSRRTLDPHALVHRRGRWYVVGHDHDRGERRAFRLDRILGSVTHASPPGAFDPPDAPVSAEDVVPVAPRPRGEATVLADPAIAWQVARLARGGGQEQPDGRSAYQVAVTDEEAFVSWALEHGPELEVRAPEHLRARVVERLVAARGRP